MKTSKLMCILRAFNGSFYLLEKNLLLFDEKSDLERAKKVLESKNYEFNYMTNKEYLISRN